MTHMEEIASLYRMNGESEPGWLECLRRHERILLAVLKRVKTHDLGDIHRGLLEHRYQLWGGERAVMITEIENYPQTKICNMFLGAGNMAELNAIRLAVERWARINGCSRIRLYGRAGWLRHCRRYGIDHGGYAVESVTFEKEL